MTDPWAGLPYCFFCATPEGWEGVRNPEAWCPFCGAGVLAEFAPQINKVLMRRR